MNLPFSSLINRQNDKYLTKEGKIMESIYTVASPSSSVVYGNIAQHTKELIKSIFPNSFFNYEHISSELAYRNIRRQLGAQARRDLAKRKKPYLVIRPIISVPDEMYLYNTPLTSNNDYMHTSLDKNVLIPIINDTEEALRLMFKLNRDKIEFQISVTVSTFLQQIDIYKSLANVGLWNRPFTRRLPLEYMIPRPIVAALASRQGMDLSKEVYAADIFLDHINKHSNYPITYKMRNATSRDEYFMYSNQEVLFTFEDFTLNEGQYKNMAQDSFELTFRVTAEFNIPGLFGCGVSSRGAPHQPLLPFGGASTPLTRRGNNPCRGRGDCRNLCRGKGQEDEEGTPRHRATALHGA